MTNEYTSIIDAKSWERMPLTSIDDVLSRTPQGSETYKVRVLDWEIDLSGRFPTSFARTPSGRRFDLSVLECNLDTLNDIAVRLYQIRDKGAKIIIGCERDSHHGIPIVQYVSLGCGQEKPETYLL